MRVLALIFVSCKALATMVVGAQARVKEWLWADELEAKKRVERVLKEAVEARATGRGVTCGSEAYTWCLG